MVWGALIGAGASLLAGRSNRPKQQQTGPWKEAMPYLMGEEGERQLREGVEPIYASQPLSMADWAESAGITGVPTFNGQPGFDRATQQEYDRYVQNLPGAGELLNPESDYITTGGTPGLLPEATRLYEEGGFTPEQQNLNEQYTNQIRNQYDSMGNSIMNNSNELYTNMLNNEFVPDRQNIQDINPQTIQAAENTFNPNAQAAQYTASTVDPNSVQTMQSAQLGPAAQIDTNNLPQAQSAKVGDVAQMTAAQNQGYTPTGQVKDFMEGQAYNNRFLDSQIDAASQKFGQNFKENILSGITDGAVSTGGLGGSRQGIAEGIAARGAADAMSNMIGDMRSNAYNQGFGAMAGLTSQQMAGGIAQAAQNAGFQQQANANNMGAKNQGIFTQAGLDQQANLANSGYGMQGALANMGAQNQFGLAQGGYDQQANAANAGYGNQAIFGNQNALNTEGQWNTGAVNNFGLTNQALAAGIAENNTGRNQSTNVQNVANDMYGQNVNANNTYRNNQLGLQFGQTALQNQLGATGALNQGLLTNTGYYDALMGGYGAGQNANWNNLNNWAGVVTPISGMGQTSTTQQAYNPISSALGGALAGYSLMGGNNFGGWNMQGQAQPLLNNPAFVGMM